MIAVRRRYRLAFIPKALETRQTRQNLASMEWRRVANAFAIRFLGPSYDLAHGRGLNQPRRNPRDTEFLKRVYYYVQHR